MNRTTWRIAVMMTVGVIMSACGPNGPGGSGTGSVSTSAPGTLRIQARGGNGTNGDGGSGNYLEVYGSYIASDIQILRTGVVNATVTPNIVKPYLGTNPRTVSLDTVITSPDNTTMLGDDNVNPATGLWVKPGVNVTIRPNYPGGAGTQYELYQYFNDGVFIEGNVIIGKQDLSVRGDGLGNSGPYTYWNCQSCVITNSGTFTNNGRDMGGSNPGGYGGHTEIDSENTFINAGIVNLTGGNGGTSGGGGGDCYFYVDNYGCYNSGVIWTYGGRGNGSYGGSGGYVQLGSGGNSNNGPVSNSGSINSRGGDGKNGGGSGNYVSITGDNIGALTNSGSIDSSGGDALVDGYGGGAQYIYFDGHNGSLRISGTLTSRGGKGAGTGSGGWGSGIGLYMYQNDNYYLNGGNNELEPRGIYIGADLDSSGGEGVSGGTAGYIQIGNGVGGGGNGIPDAAPIYLVGYESIDLSGGDGTDYGGSTNYDDDSYVNNNYESYNSPLGTYFPVKNIVNEVPWTIRGGNGGASDGGYGGDLEFSTYDYDNMGTEPARYIQNSGNIDLSGGTSGTATGGGGGSIEIYDDHEVINSGNITTSGAEGAGGGGGAGYQYLYTEEDGNGVSNSGNLTGHGGNGNAGGGGDGNDIEIYANSSGSLVGTNSGIIDTSAGDGNYGGDAGDIDLAWFDEVHNTGRLISRGGNGDTSNGGSGDYVYIFGYRIATNAADIDSGGGNSVTSNGSSAGTIYIFTTDDDYQSGSPDPLLPRGASSSGTLSARGGNGDTGGYGALIYIYDILSVTINGVLDTRSGNGVTYSNDAGQIRVFSEGTISISGTLDADGGTDTDNTGGYAGYIIIQGRRVTITGLVASRGGNSTNGYGGDGYQILILSTEASSEIHGTLTVAGGTGGAGNGSPGSIDLDGLPLGQDTVSF